MAIAAFTTIAVSGQLRKSRMPDTRCGRTWAMRMIVVDGRTDQEKLSELLQLPEQTHLEFKESLDPTAEQAKLLFVKDAVAMSNRPPGGYILIGVRDDGTLALPVGTIPDRALFDGARLGDLIRRYVEGEVHVISQVHEVDGYEVILIFFPHHRDGLPVPMSKLGQYSGQNGRPVVVFREGDVLVREGAKNTPIRHAHWSDLLSRRDRKLREDARADVDSLVAILVAALRSDNNAGPALVPLTVEMADDAFSDGVLSQFEADSDIRLRQFLGQASALVSNADKRRAALDKITILMAQAMYYERDRVAKKGIDSLFDAYMKLGHGEAVSRLDIVTRLYILGSLAVRCRRWSLIHDLALRSYPGDGGANSYASWIRHGQVDASRADLFAKGKGGLMISAARILMSEQPAMRPDIPDGAVPDPGALAHDDALLNSLCQFDILYCLLVATEGGHRGGAYPASSALRQTRADPAFEIVGGDAAARQELFPTSGEREVAEAMRLLFDNAHRESLNFGQYWDSLPYSAQQFVNDHLGGNA